MKYTGRKTALLIVVFSSLGLNLNQFLTYGYLDMIHIIASAFYLLAGWQLGKHYDEVKYLSEKDLLTDSYNRRFVTDMFPKLKSMSDRRSQKLIMFLIDVDDFKSMNDRYDHETGDRVLKMISATLKKVFRESDYIVRWGGDEFLILIPCVAASGVLKLQSRLHRELGESLQGASMSVSVSAGCAVYPDEGLEFNELLKIADGRMYSHKRSKHKVGRDGKWTVI